MSSVRQLWTITSHFNPMRYRRRFENFKHFKRALGSPLLVVELAYGEGFELSDSDADIMVQLEAESVLWQKERALNIAFGHLPAHVEYVAWVDCDLVFSEPEWPASAIEALQRFPVVQLFKNFVDLAPESTHQAGGFDYTGKSMAAFVQDGGPATATVENYRSALPGSAWAAPRLLLERHGFYDALILGGGDGAFALAAYGKFDQLCRVAQLNEAQTRHYLQWARPFFAEVQGNVGYLSGDLFHYWHGDLANRLYSERHQALRQFDFDPAKDIEIDSKGCFRWSSDKPDLHAFVKNYWNLRREDG